MASCAGRADPKDNRRIRHFFGYGLAALAVALVCWIGMDRAPQAHSQRDSVLDSGDVARGDAAATVSSKEPTQTASAVPESLLLQLVVCDLFDNRPLPDLDLQVKTKDGRSQLIQTDSDGITEVAENVVEGAIEWRCESSSYRVASSPEQIRREFTVWCVSRCEVRGRVVFASVPLEGEPVKLEDASLSVSPEFVAEDALSPSRPGRVGWIRSSALRDLVKKNARPDENGNFTLLVPRLGAVAVVARARGYRPAWEKLDDAALRGEREVLLVLEPGYRIEGTARDVAGVPLVDARVHVYVVIRRSLSEFDYSSVGRIRSGGFTCKRSVKEGWAIQTLHYVANVDPAGRWSVDVGADGETHVVCYPDGHAPIDIGLGRVSVRREAVDLVAEPRSSSRVLIQRDGRALSRRRLLLVDLSHIDVQSAVRIETDASGAVTTPFLVRGKPYAISGVGAGRPGYLTYTGQRVIDLAECETSLDKFLGKK